MVEWISLNSHYILAFLFAASELLAQIPNIKSNSVFQLLYGAVRQVSGK